MPKPSSAAKPVNQNALNGGQIKRARRREERRQQAFDLALAAVMRSTEGAVVLWEVLRMAGVNQTVMSAGRDNVLYMAGRQDIGHELLAHMVRVDTDAYVAMEHAMRIVKKREDEEEEAARTPRATEVGRAETGDQE